MPEGADPEIKAIVDHLADVVAANFEVETSQQSRKQQMRPEENEAVMIMEMQRECNALFQECLSSIFQDFHRAAIPPSHEQVSKSLDKEALSISALVRRLGTLILRSLSTVSSPPDGAVLPRRRPIITDRLHLSVAASSVGQYLNTLLDASQLRAFAGEVDSASIGWLRNLFKIPKHYHGLFSSTLDAARISVFQCAIQGMLENSDGTLVRPSFYVSQGANFPVERFCAVLGLPLGSAREIPCERHLMDLETLESIIAEDASTPGRKPLLIVASYGYSVAGHLDSITKLREICTKYGLWLHVEGPALALLTRPFLTSDLNEILLADSVTIEPSKWFGLCGDTSVTFFKKPLIGQASFPESNPLAALPVWMHLQRMGETAIVEEYQRALHLADYTYSLLAVLPCLMPVDPGTDTRHVVVFRYSAPEDVLDGSACDLINQILAANTAEMASRLLLEQIDYEGRLHFRFAPIENAHLLGGQVTEAVDLFIEALSKAALLWDSAIQHRQLFAEALVKACPNTADIVPTVPNWVGLGAFRYVPEQMAMFDLQQDITDFNASLAVLLADPRGPGGPDHGLFSVRADPSGIPCICVSADLEQPVTPARVAELSQRISKAAATVESSSRVLDRLADVVQKSIKDAEKQLQEEMDNATYQEGIIRKLPVVGSLFNYVLPFTKPSVRGRTFDLSSRTLETTEKDKIRNPASPTSSGRTSFHGPRSAVGVTKSGSQRSAGTAEGGADGVSVRDNASFKDHNSLTSPKGQPLKQVNEHVGEGDHHHDHAHGDGHGHDHSHDHEHHDHPNHQSGSSGVKKEPADAEGSLL